MEIAFSAAAVFTPQKNTALNLKPSSVKDLDSKRGVKLKICGNKSNGNDKEKDNNFFNDSKFKTRVMIFKWPQ